MDERLLGEFNKFEGSISGLRTSSSGCNDDKIPVHDTKKMEVELEDSHRSIDIKEDNPILKYQLASNEKTPSHSNNCFQIKIEEEELVEDLHHSIDIKEETSMNESKADPVCKMPLLIRTGKKSFECNICDYIGLNRGSLNRHLLTTENPYGCSICDYKRSRKEYRQPLINVRKSMTFLNNFSKEIKKL